MTEQLLQLKLDKKIEFRGKHQETIDSRENREADGTCIDLALTRSPLLKAEIRLLM